jgi:precorrin-6A/cobalt-precorrin-6A reductase
MIDRPALPLRTELSSVAQVLDWLDHSGVNLGV